MAAVQAQPVRAAVGRMARRRVAVHDELSVLRRVQAERSAPTSTRPGKEQREGPRTHGEAAAEDHRRDHGGHREGRRNFIENTPYKDEKDGSNRMRVRFNIKGPYGEGFAFAEVSDQYDGFVYLMVQNRRTAVVHTLVDNRMMLAAQAPRNEKERSALAGLLGTESSSTGEKTDKW